MRVRFTQRATSSLANSLDRANSQMWSSKVEICLNNMVSNFLSSSSVWRLLTKSSRKSWPSHLAQSKKTNTLGYGHVEAWVVGLHDLLKIVGDQVAHCGPQSCLQFLQENTSGRLYDSEKFLEAGVQIRSHYLVYSSKLSHEELRQDSVHLPHCSCIVDCLEVEGAYFLHCFLHSLAVLIWEFMIIWTRPAYVSDGKNYIPILGLQAHVPHQMLQRFLGGNWMCRKCPWVGTLSILTSLHGGGGGIGEFNSSGGRSCSPLSSLVLHPFLPFTSVSSLSLASWSLCWHSSTSHEMILVNFLSAWMDQWSWSGVARLTHREESSSLCVP